MSTEAELDTADKQLRPTWDQYFLGIAEAVSRRADCSRKRVGAVIVNTDHRIIATGYNGAEPGGPSCLAGQCPRGQLHPTESGGLDFNNCIALHAEQNALLWAGERTDGATLYCTHEPCIACWKLIRGARIKRVLWP